MKRILKYGLLGLVIVLVLIAGVISYFVSTFNPNEYKPQIIQAVKDKQQRTLKLDGDIKLTIFPSIGAIIEKISLSEYNSSKQFAAVESARVSVALLPLLSRRVVVNEVALSGVKVSVVKFKDGSSNLDDLLGRQESKEESQAAAEAEAKPQAAVNFDIAGVTVENTVLSYRDEATGAQYTVKDINLKTGRIANGVPVKISLDAMVQANKPELNIAAKIQTQLTFDLEKNFYQLEGLDLQMNGTALDISKLQLKASGNASANLATQEFNAKKLVLTATGIKGKDNFEAGLEMPSLNFTRDKVASAKISLNARLDGEMGKVIAALSLQDMQGNSSSFKSGELLLDVDFKQPEQAFKLKLSTPLVGSLEAKQLNLSSLVFALNASGEKLPNKSVSSEMKGSVQIDGGRESVHLNLAGGLLQSQIKAKLALKNFSSPAIRFDLDVDQFDADPYLPKKSAAAAEKSEPAPEQPFDLSALKNLNVQGGLRLGSLKIANIKASQLRVDVKALDGQLDINPLSANLYQGSMKGSIVVKASQSKPGFEIKQALSAVQIGPLLKDAVDLDIAEGKGNVGINLTTQGNTVSALKKSLNGTLGVNLENGAIKGVDLGKLVHAAKNIGRGKGVETLKPVATDRTSFTEFKANFKVNNGVARNDDLLVKSQSLRVTGNGDVDIGNSSINYAVKATVADSVDVKKGSLTVPVQLSGPFADLKFKVDYGAVVTDVVKQKVDAKVEGKKEELKKQLQEKLKGGLKNLLK